MLRQLNQLVCDRILVIGGQRLDQILILLSSFLFDLDQVLQLALFALNFLLFLHVVTFHSHKVLIELVLSEEVAASPLVQGVNLSLLVLHLQIQLVIYFVGFLQLQLQESVFFYV